jgi:hypothetical protein
MIDLIEQGIHEYLCNNIVHKDNVKVYLHPIVKGYIQRELIDTYMNHKIDLNDDIIVMGIKIVTGYDLKKIVIASPDYYNREPVIINIDELINL